MKFRRFPGGKRFPPGDSGGVPRGDPFYQTPLATNHTDKAFSQQCKFSRLRPPYFPIMLSVDCGFRPHLWITCLLAMRPYSVQGSRNYMVQDEPELHGFRKVVVSLSGQRNQVTQQAHRLECAIVRSLCHRRWRERRKTRRPSPQPPRGCLTRRWAGSDAQSRANGGAELRSSSRRNPCFPSARAEAREFQCY